MRIAIISSYDESCGNASFTKVLRDSLQELGHEVTPIALNLNLTQSRDPKVGKIGDAHISQIAKSLKNYDAVNIQFEAGLYGSNPRQVLSRLEKLIKSSDRVMVTHHSPRILADSYESVSPILKDLAAMRLKKGLYSLAKLRASAKRTKSNRKVIELCKSTNTPILVHTLKSKELIKAIFNYDNVEVHPLVFSNREKALSKFDWHGRLNLKSDTKLIGVFGYISRYKGHLEAVRAIAELPEDFVLVIAGRQHPQSIVEYSEIDGYLSQLLGEIYKHKKGKKRVNILSRVIFCNELDDDELINLISSVDYTWLPYQEVGQDGSGIASLAFEHAQRIIASNAKSFDELIKLVPEYKCERFDIGNHLELANKTMNYREYRKPDSQKIFNLVSQANKYLELMK